MVIAAGVIGIECCYVYPKIREVNRREAWGISI